MLARQLSFEPGEAGAAAAKAPPTAPRLLVIDDDDLHRMIICRVGAKAGYVSTGAATYEEAAELVQTTTFDCITLDLSLGPRAGIEMVRYLHEIACKSPIIIISGCDGATCRETLNVAKLLGLNVVETMRKPVEVTTLRYSLERIGNQVHRPGGITAIYA